LEKKYKYLPAANFVQPRIVLSFGKKYKTLLDVRRQTPDARRQMPVEGDL